VTLSLRRASLAASLYFLFCALVCGAQNINVDQIRTGTTNNGNVVTTVNGTSVWAPAPGGIPSAQGTAPIQVNGASGVPATDAITVSCPTCGAGAFQFQPTPPQSGQFVVIFPTAVTPVTGGLGPSCGSQPQPTGSVALPPSGNAIQNSAVITNNTCGNTITNNTWGANWTFTGALESQAPEVIPANVTSVFAFSESSEGPFFAGTNTPTIICTGPGNAPSVGGTTGWTLQQFTGQVTATGAQVDSITCAAVLTASNPAPQTVTLNIPAIGLMVFYTGTAPPVSTALQCLPPFFCSSTTGLGVDPLGPYFTLTTNGTSGEATYSGGILNIPDYASGSTGLSGMTAGQVPIAATPTTVTSSKALAGSGAAITTGPSTTTATDCANFADTHGTLADSGSPCGGGGGTSALTETLANDPSVGTTTGLLACYTDVNTGIIGTCSVSQSGVQGTNGNVPWVGVCISGCGTTGLATIQYAGPVSWICDDSVSATADAVQPSITNAGECHQPAGESNAIPNENPESNSFLGQAVTGNSGSGTAATINLFPFPFYRVAPGGLVISSNPASPYLTVAHLGQATSSYTIPFALTGNGLATTQVSGNGNFNTNYGLSTFGTSGRDTVLDSLSNGFGEPPTEMLALVGSQYQIPAGTTPGTDGNGATFTPPSISGTWAPGGISGDFCVGGTSGMYIIRLAGNTTQGPAQPNIEGQGCDNPGHIIYFEVMPPSSGGPFTLTWASNFVNPPTVSLSSGASPVLASFLFDGANYNCIIGCAGSGGGAVSSVFGRAGAVTANTGDYTFAQVTGAAPLASPAFTEIPTAPTAAALTNTTQLATTAFVTAALAAAGSAAGIVTYSGPSLTFTGTAFFPIGGGGLSSTTETNVDLAAPASATVKNFTVQLSVAPGTGNSIAFTWRDNATSTAITCTVSGSATSCSDLTHSFTASAGDLLDIQAVTAGTILSASTAVMGTQVGVASSGGGGSGALTQIAQAVVTTATPTVTFSSIPGNFTNLEIRATAMETGSAGEDLKINFNGDNTSGNYSYAFYPIQETGSSTNGANLGHFCFNQNTTNPAMCTIQINGYSSSVFTKLYTSTNYVGEIGIGNLLLFQGLWGNTNPITSIVIGVDGANNLAPGTTFTLYGLQ
jgi:hypothetical protein